MNVPGASLFRLHFALGVLSASFALAGCDGNPLELWHEVYLDEEFRAQDLNEVATFRDYQRLEDRLYQQLETEIYAEVPTGPAYALVRYSKGSASDPATRQPNWNRSFELTAENPVGAALLLHGMSDSPYSLRSLGTALNERGYWVIGLRLPGHGTAPSGLLRITWQDMAAAVQLAAVHLDEVTNSAPLHLFGYSNGAPLALNYALDAMEEEGLADPASLVLLSPAIGLATGAGLASWKRALSKVPGLERQAWLDVQPEFDPYKYNSFATNAGAVVFDITQRVARRVAARSDSGADPVLPPVLAIKSTVDATVSTQAVVDNLLARLRAGRHELVLYDINRFSRISSVLVADPGPLTAKVMDDGTLPFSVTLLSNANSESRDVVMRRKGPFSNGLAEFEPLDMQWSREFLSLSHIAIPFAPHDPLYGATPPADGSLFLGQLTVQGERGMMRVPASYFVRLRHNPFYDYQQQRIFGWLETHGTARQ
jgi:pimeloyl-ACP methyl ester carboxylesterase